MPSADGMSDLWLRCESESQYTQWMAACRLAAKGKNLADFGFEQEVGLCALNMTNLTMCPQVSAIKAFLSMQHPAHAPAINPATLDIQVEDYIAPRFSHKRKSKLRQKILEAHANVKDLNLIEAKMNFIKAWQSLPEFGISLFVVKFHGERREELVGIAFNRLTKMSLPGGDHLTSWRYNSVKVSSQPQSPHFFGEVTFLKRSLFLFNLTRAPEGLQGEQRVTFMNGGEACGSWTAGPGGMQKKHSQLQRAGVGPKSGRGPAGPKNGPSVSG